MITVRFNVDSFRQQLNDAGAEQLPFAISVALNETALEFQRRERAHIERTFTVRRSTFVLQGIKINRQDFAKKGKLRAVVHVDPARDFLIKFEGGGRKIPRGQSLAIPEDVRRSKADIVTRANRPVAFQFTTAPSAIGPLAAVHKGQKRTFLIRRHDKTGGIWQRVGSGKRGRTRMLYLFRPWAEIDPSLRFVDTATSTAEARFAANMTHALTRAFSTARRPVAHRSPNVSAR